MHLQGSCTQAQGSEAGGTQASPRGKVVLIQSSLAGSWLWSCRSLRGQRQRALDSAPPGRKTDGAACEGRAHPLVQPCDSLPQCFFLQQQLCMAGSQTLHSSVHFFLNGRWLGDPGGMLG